MTSTGPESRKEADALQKSAMDPSLDFEIMKQSQGWLTPMEPKEGNCQDVLDADLSNDDEHQSDGFALFAPDGENDSFLSWSCWSGSEPFFEVLSAYLLSSFIPWKSSLYFFRTILWVTRDI